MPKKDNSNVSKEIKLKELEKKSEELEKEANEVIENNKKLLFFL